MFLGNHSGRSTKHKLHEGIAVNFGEGAKVAGLSRIEAETFEVGRSVIESSGRIQNSQSG